MLTLFLATGVQASQEANYKSNWDGKSSIAYDVVTIKPDMKIRGSVDPDVKIEFIIVRNIKLFDGSNEKGRVVLDLELIDYNGNHTFRTCEKSVESGHGYFYEVITEEMEAKGKIQK